VIAVRVLGPVEVAVDGAPADIGGLRQRCVLARLIAAQGRVVSADRLIEDLYSDEAPPRALAAVQSYVSHLRRALQPGRRAWAAAGVLVTSPPGYAIRLDRAAVDAWEFEDEVHRAAGLDDPAAAHDRLSAALAGWCGAAFQEFGGLAWADLEASRLDELRLLATEQLAACALRLGLAAQSVADLDRLTAEQPLREEAWRLLALALYQSGRQGDALATLRRAQARLAAELGVGTPTVYWHVGNRDELFNRLIEEITDQFGRIAPRGRTPGERITSISNALLREVRAHPQLIALSKTQGRGEAIFTKAQAVLAHELTASGLHGEEAAFAVATILFHLGGFIVLEDALSPDYRVRGAQVWAQQDAEIDETMSTSLQQEVDVDRIFRFTLDAILQSILGNSTSCGADGT